MWLKLINIRSFLFALVALVSHGFVHAQTPSPLVTIPSLNVPRYMGTWHEIAKYPNRFQKQCVSNTQAEYRLLEQGSVQVINRCKKNNGEVELVIGEARQIGAASSPKLQVRFAPSWLSIFPFVWGNYWVIDLDSKYQLAAVSEPEQEYLWILSRSPVVRADDYQALLNRLKAQGFNTDRLELTKHTADL